MAKVTLYRGLPELLYACSCADTATGRKQSLDFFVENNITFFQVKLLNNFQDQKLRESIVNPSRGGEVDWTVDEQKLLETALKKFPSDDSARWDNIASYVGKSKKDCIRR